MKAFGELQYHGWGKQAACRRLRVSVKVSLLERAEVLKKKPPQRYPEEKRSLIKEKASVPTVVL